MRLLDPPVDPFGAVEFEKGIRHPKELYGTQWPSHLAMASLMIPRGFGRVCENLNLTVEELTVYSKKFRVPKPWRREIKSKLWDQKLAKSQIVKAVNEEPMILVKALQCLLLLATVVAKKRIRAKPDIWRAVKIKAVLSQIVGPENWLSDLRQKPEALRRLREKFEEIGFLEEWEDKFDELLDAICERHCITLALAEAVRDEVAQYGTILKVTLARRHKGNIRSATSLIRFISPPAASGS